jgi:putative transposase
MIDRNHELSLTKQAELLGFSRGMVYYEPKPISQIELSQMQSIDRLHLEHPSMGTRMIKNQLNRDGFQVGRKLVRTLMRRMGIKALYKKPRNTSNPHPAHKIYPYLLRNKVISNNQVWALDTTYIPMAKGFVYLTAVIDWATRKELAHKVAITLEACHAVDVLQEALRIYPKPEIVNTDQGSQFTAHEFVDVVQSAGCLISMDGRGAWRDNVMVERLWKSVKYECVYLKAYDSVSQAKTDIAKYLNWYNTVREHSSLDKRTPNEAYFSTLSLVKQVKEPLMEAA